MAYRKHVCGETVRVDVVDNAWVGILGGEFMDVAISLNSPHSGGGGAYSEITMDRS